MALLTEFLMRLSFGLAAAMAMVPARLVTSGYYRNHLYVVLGMASLAALLSRAVAPAALGWAIGTAALSYAGSVCWLYERRRLGVTLLAAVAAAALIGAWQAVGPTTGAATGDLPERRAELFDVMRYVQTVTSGMLLGTTTAAMLLGHWYLNSPGMQLAPLKRLLLAMTAAAALQMIVCSAGLALEASDAILSRQDWLFLALRWSFGLVGVIALIWMAWKTLDVPNTQSATGILYVAVIGAFVGETMSLLLSAELAFPV